MRLVHPSVAIWQPAQIVRVNLSRLHGRGSQALHPVTRTAPHLAYVVHDNCALYTFFPMGLFVSRCAARHGQAQGRQKTGANGEQEIPGVTPISCPALGGGNRDTSAGR
jgi:hypothetical protein